MNNLSGFERKLRESLNSYEPSFDENSWKELEQQLGNKSTGMSNGAWAGIAAASVIAIGSIFYFNAKDQGSAISSLESEALVMRDVPVQRIADIEQAVAFEIIDLESVDTNTSTNETARNIDVVDAVSASVVPDVIEQNPILEPISNEADNIPDEAKSSMAAFAVSHTEVCAGEPVSFDLINKSVEGNFLWNFGDGDFDSRETPSHAFSHPGVYYVSLSVTNKKSGSIHNSPVGSAITVRQKPRAVFSTVAVESSIQKSVVKFQNESQKADDCLWIVNDQSSTEINPEFEFVGKGKYLVKLYVENDNGCADSLFKYVEIEDDVKLGAPKTMSITDEIGFMPEALKNPDVKFRMTIYDQKTPIFETLSAHQSWDGTLQDGSKAEVDKKYTWVVTIIENGTEKNAFSGSLRITP